MDRSVALLVTTFTPPWLRGTRVISVQRALLFAPDYIFQVPGPCNRSHLPHEWNGLLLMWAVSRRLLSNR